MPHTNDHKIYLQDFTVGDRFVSGEYTLSVEDIKTFARQFDPQPFHLDEAAADASFFGGLAASGWHVGAITMKLSVASLPIAGGLIGAGVQLDWPQPTRPGDTLRVESVVRDITPSRSKPDRGIITLESETLNQRGEVCQRMTAKLLAFRR
ncbi:MAG: MaoC family dehydratase [Zoogloeaceae bacterium]|jgi:acyl dehydratase|nr:MaoC family dehydratase [Zoogloeaceae bacterium]